MVMLGETELQLEISVNLSVLDHLTSGEEILARLDRFYATSHRVLWYAERPSGEEVAELPYFRLRSVELVRLPNHRFMAGGTALAILGFLLGVYFGFFTSVFVVALGLGLILFGAQGKEAYYQLHGNLLSREEQARWRIPYRGSMDFIVTVGQRSGRRLTEG